MAQKYTFWLYFESYTDIFLIYITFTIK